MDHVGKTNIFRRETGTAHGQIANKLYAYITKEGKEADLERQDKEESGKSARTQEKERRSRKWERRSRRCSRPRGQGGPAPFHLWPEAMRTAKLPSVFTRGHAIPSCPFSKTRPRWTGHPLTTVFYAAAPFASSTSQPLVRKRPHWSSLALSYRPVHRQAAKRPAHSSPLFKTPTPVPRIFYDAGPFRGPVQRRPAMTTPVRL